MRVRKWVVNLARRPDRLAVFRGRALAAGLSDVQRWPGVDGRRLAASDPDVALFPAKLRRGAVGCAVSLLRLWRKLLADGDADAYLILEDDAEFCDGFPARYEALLSTQLPALPLEWNAVCLGFTGWELFAGKRLPGPSRLVPIPANTYHGGTWAMLMSKRGAKTLVELIEQKRCDNTIDSWISALGPGQFPMWQCTPHLCWTAIANDNAQVDSDIQHETATVSSNEPARAAPGAQPASAAPGAQSAAHDDKNGGQGGRGTRPPPVPNDGGDGRAPNDGGDGRAPNEGGDGRAPSRGGDGRAPSKGGVRDAATHPAILLLDGGEWFRPFVQHLLPHASFRVQAAAESHPKKGPEDVDLLVHSVMGEEHKKQTPPTAGGPRRLLVCGEPRPLATVQALAADLVWHCCLPPGRPGHGMLERVDQATWYVPQWLTSFFERRNPQHSLGRFLERARSSLPPRKEAPKRFCCFQYANEVAERNRFFDLLHQYKPVHAIGACRNNTRPPVDRDLYGADETFYDAAVRHYDEGDYKFVIAFENTRQRGYITEKLVNPRLCRDPPVVIYCGAPDVGAHFNDRAFINVGRFASFEVAINFIRLIDSSDHLYQRMRAEPFLSAEQLDRLDLSRLLPQLRALLPPPPMPAPAAAPTTPSPGAVNHPGPGAAVAGAREALAERKRAISGSVAPTAVVSAGARPVVGEWTVVSALFDLPSETGVGGGNRTVDFYLKQRFVVDLDLPLVLFCDPKTYPKLWELRAQRGLLHKTFFVPMRLRDLPLYAHHDRIVQNRTQPPVYAAGHRNTAAYFVLTASKFYMMRRAIEANPFRSAFFNWIDHGIGHIGDGHQADPALVHEVHAQRRAKVSFCYIAYLSPSVSLNVTEMYAFGEGRCSLAASFFTGGKGPMLELTQLVDAEFERVVKAGRGHAEEQLLATIHAREPARFHLWYGDYQDQIGNYVSLRTNARAVLSFFVDRAAEDRNWGWVLGACEYLLRSHLRHAAKIEGGPGLRAEQVTHLFQRYMEACAALPDRRRDVAPLYALLEQLARQTPAIKVAAEGRNLRALLLGSHAPPALPQPATGEPRVPSVLLPAPLPDSRLVRRVLRDRPAPAPAACLHSGSANA
jgi:GR25 family glycosyltransferase involved in LPS biosynthesis